MPKLTQAALGSVMKNPTARATAMHDFPDARPGYWMFRYRAGGKNAKCRRPLPAPARTGAEHEAQSSRSEPPMCWRSIVERFNLQLTSSA